MPTITSELILYLEPSRSAHPDSLWFQVQSFFEASRKTVWSDNEALRYPAHITMVGFFDSPDAPSNDGVQQQRLIEIIDECVGHVCRDTSASVSGSTVIQGLVRPSPDSLLLAIQPASVLLQLTQHLQENLPELGLRRKRINHLSLCYWVVNNTQQQVQQGQHYDQESARNKVVAQREPWIDQAEQLARETIPLLNVIAGSRDSTHDGIHGVGVGGQSWDMVLYSIQDRDKAGLKPYPLVELKRWTLP